MNWSSESEVFESNNHPRRYATTSALLKLLLLRLVVLNPGRSDFPFGTTTSPALLIHPSAVFAFFSVTELATSLSVVWCVGRFSCGNLDGEHRVHFVD